jgi:hemolysin activation/secretion protein
VVSDSEVNVIATSNVIGKGSIVGARYVKALPQKGALTHSLSLGADSKDFKESQPGPGGFETPISSLPFVVEYRVSIARPTRLHSANVGAYTALRSLFGNNEEEFAGKRFGARPNYLYVRGSWTTDQRLGTSSVLRGRIGGQIANQPLITNEQYAAGGADTVRGYLEVERLADRGVQGSLEARRQLAPRSWGKTTLLAFVDAAHLWIIRPQAEQQAEFELYGTGVGMRLEGNRNWSAALDLAVPLADGQVTRKGEPRGHFRVEGRF